MSTQHEAIIATKSGKIEGRFEGNLFVFRGIPFAAPPVGELRWLPPQPHRPWNNVHQVDSFGTIAYLEILAAF